MYKLSSALFAAAGLVSLATAQEPIPLPEVTGDSGGNGQCGGCYVVADVAGIAFGTETLTATQVNSYIVQTVNGTTYTSTSVVFDQGQFTVNPTAGLVGTAAPAATGGPSTAYNTDGSTLVINGVTLTSPTAYNVFTAYSTTRTVYTNGACSVIAGQSTSLPTAFSVVIPSGVDPRAYQTIAENSFISAMGLPSCSAGGENFASTTHVPVNVTTTSVTAFNSMTRMPQAISIAATTPTTTVVPTSTFIPFAPIANASRVTYLPSGSGAGTILVTNGPQPTNSIIEAGASRLNSIGSILGGAIALLFGVAA